LWRAYEQAGDLDAAVRSLSTCLNILGRGEISATLEGRCRAAGYGAAAQAAADQLMETGPAPVPMDTVAWLYLANGSREQALKLAEDAFTTRSPLVVWLSVAPEWTPLRDHPRMRELLDLAGFAPDQPA
jgi:hypothetical protein